MEISSERKNYAYLFAILNIAVFIFALFLINKPLNYKMTLIILLSMFFYYITNIYNLMLLSYRLRDILLTLSINILLLVFSNLIGVFRGSEAIVFFGIIVLFQIITKYIIITTAVKNNKVLFIGKNEYTDSLLENIKKNNIYNLVNHIENDKDINKDSLRYIIDIQKVDIIVDFSKKIKENNELVKLIFEYKLKGIRYYDYMTFYEEFEKKLPISELSNKWFLENQDFEIYHNSFNLKAKVVFDILFAIVISIFAIPIMIIAAIIIKLESKGPIFYTQERIGKGNKPFKIIKFRSMRTDAEKDGPKWASQKDDRITKFGNIMRKTRIDELPQLWNVLNGEMSFVGPRPERKFFIDELEKEIPYYNLRHTVQPGLTGWAQVMYPYGASVEDAYRKLEYDLYYIKHHSFIFDIKIILTTINVVIFGKGR